MNDFWESTLESGYYDKVLSEGLKKNKGIQPNWHNITFLHIKKYIKNNHKHLDFACGPGTFIGRYVTAQSIGVDIASAQIEYARNLYGDQGNFITTEAFEPSAYHEYFDVVTILGLVEMIPEDEFIKIMLTVEKVLKPNGKVIITTPNFKSPIYFLSNLINKVNSSEEHVNKLNLKSAEILFQKTNFQKIKIEKILNFGVLFSSFGINFGIKMEKLFRKLFLNYFGFLLLIKLEKQ